MKFLKNWNLFESNKPEYDVDWKRPGDPIREMLEVELREILLEVIDLGYRPQLSGFTKGFSQSGPYVWICNHRRLSHDDFWNEISDTVERVKEYLTSKGFTTSQEIINEGTRNEQVYIYFGKVLNESSDIFESVHDTKQEIEDAVSTCKDILLDANDTFSGNSLVDKVYKDNEVVITCFYTVPFNIKSKLEEYKSTMSDIHGRLIEYMTSQGFTYNNRGDKYTAYFDMMVGSITYNIAFSKELDKEFIGHLRYLKKYNLLNESVFYLTNKEDKSSKELSNELEYIEDSTLDLVDSGCVIKVRTFYVDEKLPGLTIIIETRRLNLLLPIEVGDNLLTIDSYLRELGFVGYNPYEYDNPHSPSRHQTYVDASLDDVKNYFENELSQFINMLSRFTVKAPFDTVKVSYFRPDVIETDN